jgi:hypothetical protein
MWAAIAGFFSSLFGGKGNQVGWNNKTATGSTTGLNSPVINAGGNVTLSMGGQPITPEEKDELAEARELIPTLLENLRKELVETPLVRTIIVLRTKSIAYNWPDIHLRFSEDVEPNIRNEINYLLGHRLIQEEKGRFAYRITEKFASLLRKSKPFTTA